MEKNSQARFITPIHTEPALRHIYKRCQGNDQTLCKKCRWITLHEQKQAKNNDGAVNRTLPIKRISIATGTGRVWEKQTSEAPSHVLCDGEALAVSRLRDLGHHFWKPGDFANIAVSKVLHSTFRGTSIIIYSYNKSQWDALFLNFIW